MMKAQKQIKILMNLNMTGSTGLLIWWFLFPLVLPMSEASDNFQNLILNNNWIAASTFTNRQVSHHCTLYQVWGQAKQASPACRC